jgi:soluble lytic murein transglycosylase
MALAIASAACDDDERDEASTPGVDVPSATQVAATATSTPRPPEPSEAERLRYEGEFEAALEAYAEVAASAAGDERAAAQFAQAQLLLREERFDEARLVLAEYLGPGGPLVDASVARFMQAQALAGSGDVNGALAAYDRHALAGGALGAYARAEQALILAGAGRIEEARAAADAVAISGVRPGYLAGFALRLAGEFNDAGAPADALAWYRRVIAEEGDVATALTRSGEIKRALGDPSWTADFLAVIENYAGPAALPLIDELDAAGVPVSDYLRGHVQYRARADAVARESLTRAIAAGDRPADATYYIAAIDERAGSTQAAIDGYARVPLLNPASPLADNALWWRGRLFELAGNASEATANYGQLIDAYPASEFAADARFHRGLALYRAGEYQAAALAWAAIAQNADDSDRAKMLFWRGRAQMDAGDAQSTATFALLIDQIPGEFYALRAETIIGEHDTTDSEPDLDPPATNWNAIARHITAQFGVDPAIVPPGPEDRRWATGAALEEAGLHDESIAVYLSMRRDAGADIGALYRLTRRLDEEGRTGLAARAASTLIDVIDDAPVPPPDDLLRVAYPLAYGDLVADAAEEQDVSPLLLLALVRQESFYDRMAGSSAGALGLTQVIEPTGRAIADDLGVDGFTVTDLFRPRLSLRFGASYIADQVAAFDGNAYHALAAYNGGPGTASDAIDAAGGDIDLFVEALEFDETKLYVKLVMENYARYRQLYAGVDRPSLPQ